MYTVDSIKNEIFVGNALDILKQFPDESVDCLVTSPPYHGLRCYGTAFQVWDGDPNCEHDWKIVNKKIGNKICNKCGAIFCELGQEPDPLQYVNHLVQIFVAFKRVMKATGTMWINISDSYYSSENGKHSFLKDKDLVGTSWMLALELQKQGFYLRNDIIWSKNNPMPRSVKDRCTESHEHIFLFTKSPNYYFDLDAIREPAKTKHYSASKTVGHNKDSTTTKLDENGNKQQAIRESSKCTIPNPNGRQKRDVWEVNCVSSTSSFKELKSACGEDDVHPAAYSEELINPCILAGSPPQGIVFDPFSGAGTTAVVALKNKRLFSGTEINPKFREFALKRIANIDMDKINGNNSLRDIM
jgi:DNA modification methylase